MIGILDPALLLPRDGESQGEDEFAGEIDEILRVCQEHHIEILEIEEYWPELWRSFGRSLAPMLKQRRAKQALDELRKFGRAHTLTPLEAWCGRVWGFAPLFDGLDDMGDWTGRMAAATIRAASTGRATVLLIRRMIGRNLDCHAASGSTLHVSNRWLLRLHVRGGQPSTIPCVHHRRNLRQGLRWTTRFDWRLPAEADGARYPFCPPPDWWKREVSAFRTMESRPVWLDCMGNGWARPNITDGRGYHWDVYIKDVSLVQRIGLTQLNIVEFGAPPRERSPGDLHHLPRKKQAHLRDDSGWSCD